MHVARDGVRPASLGLPVILTRREPALVVLAHALESADQETAGPAGRIEKAQRAGFLVEARERLVGGGNGVELAADGLLDDVVHDIARGVVNAAGFADLRFFFDGHAPALRAHDFAEKPLVHAAQDLHGDDAEQIRRFVRADLFDEVA